MSRDIRWHHLVASLIMMQHQEVSDGVTHHHFASLCVTLAKSAIGKNLSFHSRRKFFLLRPEKIQTLFKNVFLDDLFRRRDLRRNEEDNDGDDDEVGEKEEECIRSLKVSDGFYDSGCW